LKSYEFNTQNAAKFFVRLHYVDDTTVTNLAEAQAADYDLDGIPNDFEVAHGLSPLLENSLEDADGDGVPNIFEYKNGTSPSDATSRPVADRIVDPRLGDSSSADQIYRTIYQAIDAASSWHWNDVLDEPGSPPRPYQIIQIKSGVYFESLRVEGIPMLILGEKGAATGPVVIMCPQNSVAVSIESASVLDGLVITHESGYSGQGVQVTYEENEPDEPVMLKQRRLVNCLIRGNHYTSGGAGIDSYNAHLSLVHCTISGNTGPSNSTGIKQSGGELTLINSIVWGNTGNPLNLPYRQLFTKGDAVVHTFASTPSIIGDANVISAAGWLDNLDPQLTPSGWLKSNSPAINAGGLIVGSPVLVDIHGESRNATLNPDIGVDEYNAQNSLASEDTDDDGLYDNTEIFLGSNLLDSDTDHDGMPDGYEYANGLALLDDRDALADKDSDRIPNLWEYKRRTLPLEAASCPLADWIVDPALAGTFNNFATIQEAIDHAPSSNTAYDYYSVIEVKRGVYKGNISIPPNKKITLLGELGYPATEIHSSAKDSFSFQIRGEAFVDGFRLSHSSISGNASFSGHPGLHVLADGNQVSLSNLLIHGFHADHGAGITLDSGRLRMLHCTIYDTAAAHQGNAISLGNGTTLDMVNSIIRSGTGNASQQIEKSPSAVLSVSGSFIKGGEYGGNVTDPMLTPEGWLRKGSPAINFGTSYPVFRDIHNESRSGNPDAGVDEFTDADGDALPNWLEALGVVSPTGNNDTDSLSNLFEYEVGGSNPLSADTDADGLNDAVELTAGTNVRNFDTDGDGMGDGAEVANFFSPINSDEDGNGTLDGADDTDGDGCINILECDLGSDPHTDSPTDRSIRDFANATFAVIPLDTPPASGNSMYWVHKITDKGEVQLHRSTNGAGTSYIWGNSKDVFSTHPYIDINRAGYYSVAIPENPAIWFSKVSAYTSSLQQSMDISVTMPDFGSVIDAQFEEYKEFDYTLRGHPFTPGGPLICRDFRAKMLEDGSFFADVSQSRHYNATPPIPLGGNGSLGGWSNRGTPFLQRCYWAAEGANPILIGGTPTLYQEYVLRKNGYIRAVGGMGTNAFCISYDWDESNPADIKDSLILRSTSGTSTDLRALGFYVHVATSRNGHIAERTLAGGVLYNYQSKIVESLPYIFRGNGYNAGLEINDNGDILTHNYTRSSTEDAGIFGRKFLDPTTGKSHWAKCRITDSKLPSDWTGINVSALGNTMSLAAQQLLGSSYPPPATQTKFPPIGGTAYKDGIQYPVMLVPIDIEEVISDQIAGNECNKLPTPYYRNAGGTGGPNNPMLMATKTGRAAHLAIKMNVTAAFASKIFVGVREVGSTTILASTASVAAPGKTLLQFTANTGHQIYEVVAGYDANANAALENSEVATVFEKTPKKDSTGAAVMANLGNLDKIVIVEQGQFIDSKNFLELGGDLPFSDYAGDLIEAFGEGATTVPDATTTFGIEVNSTHPSLTHQVGAEWNAACQDTTHRLDFDDGTEPSDDFESSNALKTIIDTVIQENITALIAHGTGKPGWPVLTVPAFSKGNSFRASEGPGIGIGSINELHLAFGSVTITGTLQVSFRVLNPTTIEVGSINVSGSFDDLYDFDYWSGSLPQSAAIVQAGYASLSTTANPSGKIFYTKLNYSTGWRPLGKNFIK
jgi:Bacterial TSP3 repeat